jgi:hypothetical protein
MSFRHCIVIFKKANFLKYLPVDLVGYMKHITDLNRDRNTQILEQAQALNSLLLANNIRPIFLKGTGNLLAEIYDNIAERMVGDIGFIFSKEDYPKAVNILRAFGYGNVSKNNYHFPAHKHYRRLQKENNIAAIEIHKELLIEKYANEFKFDKYPNIYPIYFFKTDTSGEKFYEEFYTEEEDYEINKYDSLGFINTPEIEISFYNVECDFERIFKNPNSNKLDVINIIKKYVPDFIHIETGKFLDQKM